MGERNLKAELREKWVPTLALAFFAIVGLTLLISHGIRLCKEAIPRGWDRVPATILSAKVRSEEKARFLDVRYEYAFDGKRMVGRRFNPSGDRLDRMANEAQIKELFPIGAVFTCRVNPRSPTESFLQLCDFLAGDILITLFPLGFVALGTLGLWALWRRAPGRKPKDEGAARRWIPRVAWSVSGLFGVVVLYGVTLDPLVRPNETSDWLVMPCTITLSEIGVTGRTGKGRTLEGWYLAYAYWHDGLKRVGTRYDCSIGQPQGMEQLREFARRYPVGSQTVCYVNPEEPGEAVLSRGMTVHGIQFFPPILIVVGGAVFFFSRRARLRSGERLKKK